MAFWMHFAVLILKNLSIYFLVQNCITEKQAVGLCFCDNGCHYNGYLVIDKD